MSLQTIVSKMIAANEPESNIAKVIKYHKKDSSKINCEKCDHSWKIADGGNDLYTCHECGHNNNNKNSPLKAIVCPPGFIDNEDGLGCVEEAKDAEALKRNEIDKVYAQKAAPVAIENNETSVSNTREEILERQRECPPGFKKVNGECIEVIATEQLEEVVVTGQEFSPEIEELAEKETLDYFYPLVSTSPTEKNNIRRKSYKENGEGLSLEELNSFKQKAAETRVSTKDLLSELQESVPQKIIQQKIDSLSEKADQARKINDNIKLQKDDSALGKSLNKSYKKTLEANEKLLLNFDAAYAEYTKTGKWPFTVEDQAEIDSEIKSDIDNAMTNFSSDIPDPIRKYNTAVMNEQVKVAKEKKVALTENFINDTNLLGYLVKEFKKTDDNSIKEKIRQEAIPLLKKMEIDQDYLQNLALQENDIKAGLDFVRRDYSVVNRMWDRAATVALEMGLSAVNLGNVITGENPEAGFGIDMGAMQDKLSKDLSDRKEYTEMFLPKPLSVDDVDNMDDIARYVGQTAIDFTTSGIAMGIGAIVPGAALPLFANMGYSKSIGDFLAAKMAAEKALPDLIKKLETKQSFLPGEKEALQKQINKLTKDANIDNLTMFGVSAIDGIGEAIEGFTQFGIATKSLRWAKVAGGKPFNEGIRNAVTIGTRSYVDAAARETIAENVTNVIQNWNDITNRDADKSYFEGATDVTASAILLGLGLNTVPVSRLAQSVISEVVSNKAEKAKNVENLQKINELGETFDKLQKQGPRNEGSILSHNKNLETIQDQIEGLKKEIVQNQKITSAKFLKLSPAQQKEVMEKDRKRRALNKEWQAIVLDPSITEKEKNLIREGLQKEFDILDISIRETIDGKGDLQQGDYVREVLLLDHSIIKGKEFLKGKNWVDNAWAITNKDLENAEKFIKTEESGEIFELEDGSKLNREQTQQIIDAKTAEDSSGNVSERNAWFDPETRNIGVYTDRAAARGGSNSFIHEALHAAEQAQGFTEEQYNGLLQDFQKTLDKGVAEGSITTKQRQDVIERLDLVPENQKSKELLTSISDAINKEVVSEEDAGFLVSVGSKLKDMFDTLTGNQADIFDFNWTDSKEVFDFVKDFNRSVYKSKEVGGETKISTREEEEELSSRPLLDAINNLVPSTIQTKEDFQNPRVFNEVYRSVTRQDGAINNYIKSRSESIEEGQKIIVNVTDRLITFDPEAKRSDGKPVGVEGFGEFIFANTRFGKLDARLDLFKESQKRNKEQSTDTPQAQAVLSNEVSPDEITIKPSSIEALKIPKSVTSKLLKGIELSIPKAIKEVNKAGTLKQKVAAKRKAIFSVVKKVVNEDANKDVFKSTKEIKTFDNYVDNNWRNLGQTFLDNTNINNITGSKNPKLAAQTKNKLQGWKDNGFTKEDVLSYFNDPNIAKNTRSDRKNKSLKNAVINDITNDVMFDYVSNNPEASKDFKDKTGITLSQLSKLNAIDKGLTNEFIDKVISLKGTKQQVDNFLRKTSEEQATSNPEFNEAFEKLFEKALGGQQEFENKGFLSRLDNGLEKIINNKLYQTKGSNITPAQSDKMGKDHQRNFVQPLLENYIPEEIGEWFSSVPKGLNFLKQGLFKGGSSRGNAGNSQETRDLLSEEFDKSIKKSNSKNASKETIKTWKEFYKVKDNFSPAVSTTTTVKKIQKISNNKNLNVRQKIKEIQNIFNPKELEAAKLLFKAYNFSMQDWVNYETSKKDPMSVDEAMTYIVRDKQKNTNFVLGERSLAPIVSAFITEGDQQALFGKIKGEHINDSATVSAETVNAIFNNTLQQPGVFDEIYYGFQQSLIPKKFADLLDKYDGANSDRKQHRFLLSPDLAKNTYDLVSGRSIYDILKSEMTTKMANVYEARSLADQALKRAGLKLAKENSIKIPKETPGIVVKAELMFNNDSKILSSLPKSSRTFYEDGDGISQIQAPLSKGFNEMIERTKGVKSEARYSDARAAKMGGKTGFQAFVPYSAEDFLGLIYPTLGKGEQGNQDLKWWKDNVMNPYNDGMTQFESSKQASMLEWKQIKDQIKNTPANLGKEAVRDFSNEDAIRVYLWDKSDNIPNDLSKKDVKALVKHVNSNQELRDFAIQVSALDSNGYPAPTKNWLAGTITTDLVNHVNTTTRSEMLAPWQEAIDEIYTNDNKNKLRATYGDKYVEALDDVLYRMKTGRNRPSGANRITNNWLNWVNDSVGTIMFFNQRSAILQTISSINFINWSDNNPAAAAKAFANQKQYWKDFSYLFNSDFLKQRRSGLKTDVNADEIAQQAAGSTNKVRAGLSLLLKKGFLPTQIADSFAIASGGSTFYRNRVNALVKSGMSKIEAEKQAFSDFRDSANESQQSSDPSRVSMEQASSLGRVILAFANTPIQYTRLTKRAVQDLAAGRGDWKTNVSKIVYYGAVQNIIFTTLQQAMFGMLFSDDDDEFQNSRKDQAAFNVANSTVDTFLRGSGVAGAFVAMLKNMALEVKRQKDSRRPDYTKVADKLFSVSPPIDSKFRKLKSAGRAFTYKQELEKMRNKGVAIDNPALMAVAQVISAFGNIPADRVVRKLNNIVESTNNKNAIWQRMALIMGWGQWELGITDRKTNEARAKKDSFKGLEKSIKKVVKKRKKEEAKEAKEDKKTPIKALEAGVLGEANRDGSIVVAKGLSKEKRKEVIRHEKVHQKEISSGKLDYDEGFVYYGKKKYERNNGKIMHNGKAKVEGDHSLPWEKVAHKH